MTDDSRRYGLAIMPDTNQKPSYEEGSDAVCFTAGTEVAAFGAGTIHAYLATERAAPVVVAGISSGAIVAAVMKRCYAEAREITRAE